MPADMRAIAERVGVSRTTVHRALSGTGRISEDTRQKILRVAREVDYRPNNLARGLRSHKSATIGVIVTGLNSFYASILEGTEDLAAQEGYSVLLARSAGSAGREERHLDVLREKRVDGILVAPSDPHKLANYYRKLLDSGPSFVFIDRDMPGVTCDCVMTDNYAGGAMAGRHLVSLGRKKIAFGCVAPPDMHATSVLERIRGLRTALGEAGQSIVAFIGENQPLAQSRAAFAANAVESFIRDGGDVDAIFAANDATAIGIMSALRKLGVSVPDDVAVVGFDGLDISWYVRPALTTIKQDARQMGREAMRLLLERISSADGVGRGKRILLPPELVARESCGARKFGEPGYPLDDDFPE